MVSGYSDRVKGARPGMSHIHRSAPDVKDFV